MKPEVRSIPFETQYPLRGLVLQQPATPKNGDEDPETLHVGVYLGEVLVSIASIYRAAPPEVVNSAAWQLRGVATLPDYQGKGYGKLSVGRCFDYAAAQHARLLWCNARVGALDFYRSMGMQVRPDSYEIPGRGVRYYCWKELN